MARAPGKNRWVTKTDVLRYFRCPYAFWILDTGQLSFTQTVTPLQAGLIDAGMAFQQKVEAVAKPIVVDVEDLPSLFAAEDRTVYLSAMSPLENEKLGLRGLPDGVQTAGGALVPIEMKSHRDVMATDRLELAFYWLLLEPYRTRSCEPRGVVILRRNGAPVEVEVPLMPRHFDEVERMVAEVRRARRYGVESRICSCTVCAGPKREEVLGRAHRGRDLTLLWGVGPAAAAAMEALGVTSYADLVDCDQVELLAGLRASKRSVSAAMVRGWCHHAQSYSRSEAVLFGSPPTPSQLVHRPGPGVSLRREHVVDRGLRRRWRRSPRRPAVGRQSRRGASQPSPAGAAGRGASLAARADVERGRRGRAPAAPRGQEPEARQAR
jgi:CRISPR/Cas system-associated exonuclease Cas4 (RecB family)